MTLYVEQQRGSAAKCAAFELGVPLVSPLASPLLWGSGVAKDSPAATARANGAGVAV